MSIVTLFQIIAVLLIVMVALQIYMLLRVESQITDIHSMLDDMRVREMNAKKEIKSNLNDDENKDVRDTLDVVEYCKLTSIQDKREDSTTTGLFNYLYGLNGYRLHKAIIHSTEELMDYIKNNRVIYDIRCNKFRVVRDIRRYGTYTLLLRCTDGNTITFLSDCFAKVEVEKSELQRIA